MKAFLLAGSSTEGTLAAAAWFGFLRLPKHGLYRILEVLGAPLPNVVETER